MDTQTAQALVRFGLGRRASEPAPTDPARWLVGQLQGPDPARIASAPSTTKGLEALRTDRERRKAEKALATNVSLAPNGAPLNRTPAVVTPGETRPGQPFRPQASLERAVYQADAQAQLSNALTTPTPFRERLVWFWTNHFTVSILQGETAPLVGAMVREAIRPHVNGNFTDMVLAVERHPAMLRYLANENSIGPDSVAGIRSGNGLNENLGRECMELHTVGLKAGYSQADVTAMAKILTGWSVADSSTGGDATGFKYRPNAHEPGPQIVLGRSFDGGEQAGIDALTFLSTYPTTYNLLAAKLVKHFVADNLPPRAVARIAGVLRDTGGDLGAASAALVDLPEAWRPLTKLKTPLEYVISAVRAAPPQDDQPPVDYIGTLNQLGQPLWGAPLPNGWPDVAASWDGSDAIMARINWAFTYAGRFQDSGVEPSDIAGIALGGLLRPATAQAIAQSGSRREAVTMLFTAPEFQRR